MQNGINGVQNLLPQNNERRGLAPYNFVKLKLGACKLIERRGRACSPETKGQASLPVIVAVEPVN